MKSNSEQIPEGVSGWSWAAFILTPIWAIGNRVWIGLLSLIPGFGLFVCIWLGFQGRKIAWNAKEWESVERFQNVQKKWSWATLVIFVIAITFSLTNPELFAHRNAHKENTSSFATKDTSDSKIGDSSDSGKYDECKSFCAQKFRECIAYIKDIPPEGCAEVSNTCLHGCKERFQ